MKYATTKTKMGTSICTKRVSVWEFLGCPIKLFTAQIFELFVQIISEHALRKKQINTKAITDLKKCQCRRRAEVQLTTKKMSFQAVLHHLSNTRLELAPVVEQAAFYRLAVMTYRRQLKYQIFRYSNPFICY